MKSLFGWLAILASILWAIAVLVTELGGNTGLDSYGIGFLVGQLMFPGALLAFGIFLLKENKPERNTGVKDTAEEK